MKPYRSLGFRPSENGIFIFLGACLLFAVFDSLTKYLVDSFSPGDLAFFRFCFGALLTFPFLFRQRFWLDKGDLSLLILRGLLQTGVFYSMILSLRTSTLSLTMLLFYTSPVWALFMGAFFLKERLTWKRMACVACAILGIVVLTNPWKGTLSAGHIYGLMAGVMSGGSSVLTRHLRVRHDPWVIYAFVCFVGTLLSVPLISGNFQILKELEAWMMLLLLGVFGLLAQVTMNYGYRFIRSAEGATLMMAEAVFASLAGIIIFREPLTLRFLIGAILLIGSGVYLGLQSGKDVLGKEPSTL
jgi:drug/metabolite transporter (DMT)-like permease